MCTVTVYLDYAMVKWLGAAGGKESERALELKRQGLQSIYHLFGNVYPSPIGRSVISVPSSRLS